jgi:release factor glutamine methyltransferase
VPLAPDPAPAPTVGALLAACGLPRLDAQALLAAVLKRPREFLIAHPEFGVTAESAGRFAGLAGRRRRGEPLAYLLGRREFYGRSFAVSPAVLVPRPETELLVDLALELLQGRSAPRVLDLGTGSGCIAVTLALACPPATVLATDLSAAALEVARANAHALGACVQFARGSWWVAVDGAFDLIVSNPPYVAAGDPHLAALVHEPAGALVAGSDGLDSLRQIVAGAPAHLVAGGELLVEHGQDQGAAVRDLLRTAGFAAVHTVRDAAGLERVSRGRLGASAPAEAAATPRRQAAVRLRGRPV